MKRHALSIFVIAALIMLFSTTGIAAKNYIISTNNNLPANLEAQVAAANGTIISAVDDAGFAVVSFDNEADALSLQSGKLDVMPDVQLQWINPVANSTEDNQQRPLNWWQYQWHLNVIQAFDAWGTGATGAGVRVAVVDSGLDYNHIFFIGGNIDLASSASFVPGVPDVMDDNGHGTHVAGIIACPGILDWATIGVAPQATIIPIKVTGAGGSGSASWILNGVIHAVNVDADIINLSVGSYLVKGGIDGAYTANDAAKIKKAYTRVMNWAHQNGVLVVTSAGNESYDMDHFGPVISTPGECGAGVVNVSATGPINQQDFDTPTSYTNYGQSLIFVAAPGGEGLGSILDFIISPTPGNRIGFYIGTSQAAPMVAGVAALVLHKYGPMNVNKLRNHLAQTADDLGKPGHDKYYGHGRINAYKAVTK